VEAARQLLGDASREKQEAMAVAQARSPPLAAPFPRRFHAVSTKVRRARV
jgi:hypothetical protein